MKKEKSHPQKIAIQMTPGAVITAMLAAALYGISSPVSKLLLIELQPAFLAALLYLGAGFGMLFIQIIKKIGKKELKEAKLTRKELPYVIAMIVLDIGAPIFLMVGLSLSEPASVSLLNNFEIVATSFLALLIFKEAIGKRMWLAIGLITISSIVLCFEGRESITFTLGSIFVLIACCFWGLENNCTRMLSVKDPLEIVLIKGIGSGSGAMMIALIMGQYSKNILLILCAMLLGFVAYGLSIYCYIKAQRELGAARTSAYYATAPFIGVFISWLIYREGIALQFLLALIIMLIGSFLAVSELHQHSHLHEAIAHEHKHRHDDGHHTHIHNPPFTGEHSHLHTHEAIQHNHIHTPDIHHIHTHQSHS